MILNALRIVMTLLSAPATCAFAQERVTIEVDASKTVAPNRQVWNYFGYDEPNYTTADNGRKLIRELSDLRATPVNIRVPQPADYWRVLCRRRQAAHIAFTLPLQGVSLVQLSWVK